MIEDYLRKVRAQGHTAIPLFRRKHIFASVISNMSQHNDDSQVHPRSIYNWRVYAAALTASFGGALFG